MGSVNDASLSAVTFDVTAEKIALYADITNDYNPIHVDPEFAAQTPMKGIIAHGTMSLALLWQMLRQNFGPERCGRAELDIRFTRPVRIGDRLSASGSAGSDGCYEVWVANQDDVRVIDGKARL